MKPVALVTGEVSPYRREPFRLLDEAESIEVIPYTQTGQLQAARQIAAGRYRAVICGLGGRIALPAAYAAARRTRTPFVLWASLWAHPRTPAHALSWLPTKALYEHADAIVTYGPHVTRYVSRYRGNKGNVFEAPQAVSKTEFGRYVSDEERAEARARAGADEGDFLLLFVGRLEKEKGIDCLMQAWRPASGVKLALAGAGPLRPTGQNVTLLGPVERTDLPPLYAAADALVLPSIRTATFLEPWGLVVNEAMHQGTPTIASDAVGAVAGGLVKDGRNGLVFPAGDATALAARIDTLSSNPDLRSTLGEAAREDVKPYSEQAWADGMSAALGAVGASRRDS